MCLIEETLINQAMSLGLARELLSMLRGESEYSDELSYKSMDKYSSRLRGMAIKHLEFIVKFGYTEEAKNINDGDMIFSSFPDFFDAWKLAGCPGISIDKLENMIEKEAKEIPISARSIFKE